MENNIITQVSIGVNIFIGLTIVTVFIYNAVKNKDYVKVNVDEHKSFIDDIKSLNQKFVANDLQHEKFNSRIEVTESYNTELFEKLDNLANAMTINNTHTAIIINHLGLTIK